MSQISVVGIGMQSSLHLTLEAVREIALADRLFHMLGIPESIAQITQLNPNATSLVGLYQEGELDLDVYNRIASCIIAEAIVHERVVLVVMGHPSIYVSPTHLLVEHAPRYGIAVRVCAAVSAIDTILAELPFDIANTGLQILDANRIVAYELRPSIDVPLLLFQVGCFGSGYITRTTANSADRVRPLVEYLMQFYPARHPVELLESEMGWPHRQVRERMALEDLATNGQKVNYNTTLYVPVLERPLVRNVSFQEQLLNPSALERLVVG